MRLAIGRFLARTRVKPDGWIRMPKMPSALRKIRTFWKGRSRRAKARLIAYPSLVLAIVGFGFYTMSMPGKTHRGPLPALTDEQSKLSRTLRLDVESFASKIGERNSATT